MYLKERQQIPFFFLQTTDLFFNSEMNFITKFSVQP